MKRLIMVSAKVLKLRQGFLGNVPKSVAKVLS